MWIFNGVAITMVTGNIFIFIMANFELFSLPFKDKFNKYEQTMERGRKGIMPSGKDTYPKPFAGDHSIMSSTQGMIP